MKRSWSFRKRRWSSKLRMLATLGAVRALLIHSKREGWPLEDPSETAATLDAMMAHLIDPDRCACPEFSSVQFMPTGPVQEIAKANGWHDAYLTLSEEFDRVERDLGAFHA